MSPLYNKVVRSCSVAKSNIREIMLALFLLINFKIYFDSDNNTLYIVLYVIF